MFSFFKKKTPPPAAVEAVVHQLGVSPGEASRAAVPTAGGVPEVAPPPVVVTRSSWLDKLKVGLRKTGSSIASVFTGTQIDEALYEELEAALLMADTGVKATEHLLRIAARASATRPAALRSAQWRASAACTRSRPTAAWRSAKWAAGSHACSPRVPCQPRCQHPRHHVRQAPHLRIWRDMDGHRFLGRQILYHKK